MASNNYGYVLNKSQIQSQLLNKGAYKSALDQLGREASTEAGQAFQRYGDTLEAAYATSLQNRNLVSASPMFSGYKHELESDIDTQLDQIYKQASAAYQQNLSTIAEQYAKGASEIASDVGKQTDLANKYWQAHLDYYDKYLREELPNSNLMGVTLADMIKRAKSGDISPYENYIQNWFTEGEEGSRMKTVDELLTGMTERDAEGNLVFNEDTVKFLQMFEDVDTDDILRKSIGSEYKSFSNWLRENDYDVYEWAASDQGAGLGSGFNLFRELADMPENTQFRSYQSFADMPENKQENFIEEFVKNENFDFIVNNLVAKGDSSYIRNIANMLYSNNATAEDIDHVRNIMAQTLLKNPENMNNMINSLQNIDMSKEIKNVLKTDVFKDQKALASDAEDAIIAMFGDTLTSSEATDIGQHIREYYEKYDTAIGDSLKSADFGEYLHVPGQLANLAITPARKDELVSYIYDNYGDKLKQARSEIAFDLLKDIYGDSFVNKSLASVGLTKKDSAETKIKNFAKYVVDKAPEIGSKMDKARDTGLDYASKGLEWTGEKFNDLANILFSPDEIDEIKATDLELGKKLEELPNKIKEFLKNLDIKVVEK